MLLWIDTMQSRQFDSCKVFMIVAGNLIVSKLESGFRSLLCLLSLHHHPLHYPFWYAHATQDNDSLIYNERLLHHSRRWSWWKSVFMWISTSRPNNSEGRLFAPIYGRFADSFFAATPYVVFTDIRKHLHSIRLLCILGFPYAGPKISTWWWHTCTLCIPFPGKATYQSNTMFPCTKSIQADASFLF